MIVPGIAFLQYRNRESSLTSDKNAPPMPCFIIRTHRTDVAASSLAQCTFFEWHDTKYRVISPDGWFIETSRRFRAHAVLKYGTNDVLCTFCRFPPNSLVN